MPALYQSFEGGVSGLTISPANSGGAPNSPFDAVTIGSGATATYSSAHAAHGSLSGSVTTGGTAAASYLQWDSSMGTQTQVWFRQYLYFAVAPSGTTPLFAVLSSGSFAAAIQLSGTSLQITSGAAQTVQHTFTGAIPVGQWFRIEGFVTGSAAAGQVSLSQYNALDGITPAESFTTAANLNTTGACTTYQFGVFAATASASYWMDDLGLSSTGPVGPLYSVAPVQQTGTGIPSRRPQARARISAVYGTGNTPLDPANWNVIHGSCAGGAGVSRRHWSFSANGTPVGNYFVISTSQSQSVSWSDEFFVYYHGKVQSGPYTVRSFSLPFAGFVNVFYDPLSPWGITTGLVVTEGPEILQAPPQQFMTLSQSMKRPSRAWVRGASPAGIQAPDGAATGVASQAANILRPGINGIGQSRSVIPVPRRPPYARAVTAQVTGPGNASGPSGSVQPRATAGLPRRQPARAVTASSVQQFVPPSGSVQPQATVPVPRRKPARAGQWASVTGQRNASGPSGSVQPRATVPVPRRIRARAVIASASGVAFPAGSVQPRATVMLPRRVPARAVIASASGPQPAPSGSVQPRATVQVPRRVPARAVWHGNAVPGAVSRAVTGGLVRRRVPARAVIASAAGVLNAHGPAGSVQPRAVIMPPRRVPARAFTASQKGTGTVPGASGSVQPRPTVMLPRRVPARAVIASAAGTASVPGSVQPAATVALPRLRPSRAVTRFTAGPANASGPSGTIPARAASTVARRVPARAVTRSLASSVIPVFAPGRVTAQVAMQVYRRGPARGFWRSVTSASFPVGVTQPAATVRLPRRALSRAVIRSVSGVSFPNGTVPPRAAVRIPRQVPSRGFWRSVTGGMLPAGSVQPRATVQPPRRPPSRAVYHSVTAPPQFGTPVTGGVVYRRLRSRAVCRWLAVPAQTGTPVTGGLVRRRAPARAVIFKVAGPANAHGPSGAQPGGIVRRRVSCQAVCGPKRVAAGIAGRPGSSVSVDFTFGVPQPKWLAPQVQSRWIVMYPIAGWQPHGTSGTAGPGG